ncbi:UNVERIFIED_CONTAM: hypothetical protein GTU68_023312 [Idotea baltica]|nr:hypothetical protein [Idotea baltica]
MDFKQIIGHCKEYGFVYQSSEIYDGLSAVYDYGPNGVALKNNIKQYWWRSMVQMNENVVGLDSSIFMHPKVWKASGHVDAFNDPLVDNKDSKKRYRADQLIEGYTDKIEAKIKKDVEKEIACPESGSRDWTDVRQFNLMFNTQLGNIAGEDGKLYLRPETAQGIFVNFLNVSKTSRQKIPFGIAQIGKAFRNEIVARQFIFRMREFEQMEMQFFVRPGTEEEWYKTWKEKRMKWHEAIGSPKEKLRFHDHESLAHYAKAATDIEFEFPFGFKELEGIHSRGDFDLKAHQELSGKKLQYFDPQLDKNYVPFVVETSIGADRMFLSQVSNCLVEEDVPGGEGKNSTRTVMKFHPAIAPVKCAVLPLLKNHEGLVAASKDICDRLRLAVDVQYDEKDAIGRRYRRQDAIGTPFCVTVDHQSLEDNTVTLRNRDSLEQIRISVDEVNKTVTEKTSMEKLLLSTK